VPDNVAFFRPGMDTPLHRECLALMSRGLHPITIVAYARSLECPHMLRTAFPSMPQHTMNCLMEGTASLILDQHYEWIIVRYDEAANG